MSEVYCLCGGENRIRMLTSNEDYDDLAADEKSLIRRSLKEGHVLIQSVIATTPVKCIKTGARQFVNEDGELFYHKNVDVFMCPNCFSLICK